MLSEDISEITSEESVESFKKTIEPIISVSMYICSSEKDLLNENNMEAIPRERKEIVVKGKKKNIPPDNPQYIKVGFRVGNKLRQAKYLSEYNTETKVK